MIRVIKATTEELMEKAFQIRAEVFVDEQQVSREDEFDEYEKSSHHFVVLGEDDNPVGAARWRVTSKGIKLERFAVKSNRRGNRIGSSLVLSVLSDIRQHNGSGNYLYLHAQLSAVGLYAKYGFQKKGDIFSECDIEHYFMELQDD